MSNPIRLLIPRTVLDTFLAHALGELPNECCGFFAGRVEGEVGQVVEYLPLVNELASPTAFATESRSLFIAFKSMRVSGLELLAVCHSHPTSDPIPSRKDLADNTYGSNIPWVIAGLRASMPAVNAWCLGESHFRECDWRVPDE